MIAREKIDKEKIAQKAKEKIVAIMKEITETSGDLQVNHTPPEICEMMLDKVDLDKAESVLVLFNVELVYELRARGYKGQVYYFTQSTKEVGFVKKLIPDVIIKYIDKEESALDYMSTWPEKFDIIVSNPPYSKKMDLKFLDKAFDLAKEEVVFVHPATAFVEKKGIYKPYFYIREKIKTHLKSLDFFNGNGVFGIFLFVPCSITHITKNTQQKNFKIKNIITGKEKICESVDIHKLTIAGKDDIFTNLKTKIEKILSSNPSIQEIGNVLGTSEQKNGKYLRNRGFFFVETSHIRGHIYDTGNFETPMLKNDFYTILPLYTEVKSSQKPNKNIWWEFETEKEAENFIKYIKTDFVRFCLSLLKINQNLARGEMKLIPWMDFTQEWTDEKLYAHFNITEEEQAFIKEVIPPYYV